MIRVDYAGPGGACEGIRSLGLDSVGIEWDAAACTTRAAAGHSTIRADLATYRPHHDPGTVSGLWSSPPCQTFSAAGDGEGRGLIDTIGTAILARDWAAADMLDDRTRHVIDAARTAVDLRPGWVAMEQVPAVLPIWQALAHVLEADGYSTWAGVLCAADYGVPQTRRRAILMASRTTSVQPPPPTHAEHPGLFGEQEWISMADALGWGFDYEPAAAVTGGGARTGGAEPFANADYRRRLRDYVVDRRTNSRGPGGVTVPTAPVPVAAPAPAPTFTTIAGSQWLIRPAGWPWTKPATTVAGDPRISARCHHEHGAQGANAIDAADVAAGADPDDRPIRPIRLTVAEVLILQGFPPDYPVQGSRTKQFEQIGNAVPPPLAAHIVATLTGQDAA